MPHRAAGRAEAPGKFALEQNSKTLCRVSLVGQQFALGLFRQRRLAGGFGRPVEGRRRRVSLVWCRFRKSFAG